ncbi:MAG: methyltransferase domain-containing protein [Candidatus Hydrogenedens sp.]|nr:methyltransferase domain-containing protein [Candidatus Hydrogenedens sp.]
MAGFKGLAPVWLKHRVKRLLLGRESVRYGIASKVYVPSGRRRNTDCYTLDRADFVSPPHASGLPLPPPALRMDYDQDDAAYLDSGARVAEALKAILRDHQVSIEPGDSFLDWGCASGRVLRHFMEEVDTATGWGIEPAEDYVLWNKANLSPPFRFLTGTEYPHLPFPDHTFKFIYGISVFTHLEFLADQWLMEMRRVLRPDGLAVFTVHDEHSIAHLRNIRLSGGMQGRLDLDEAVKHDQYILTGESWADTFPFFSSDYIRREWGTYLHVAEIRPAFTDHGQTAVVLRG